MELEGIDTELGLYNCSNNEKIYHMVLESVYEEGLEKLPQIKESFLQKDYKSYIILVHGLKSVAMSIGAVELSNLAKSMELAAKDENYFFINEHQEDLIIQYQKLLDVIKNSKLYSS